MTWYGPDQQWPSHPERWWRDALDVARRAGWHLVTFTSKNWGRVSCTPDGGGCTVLIFTTGTGSESVAKNLVKRVRRCPHHRDSESARVAMRRAAERLEQAEKLLTVLEGLVAAQGVIDRAYELADGIDDAVEDAARLLDRALEMEAQGRASVARHERELEELRQGGASPTEALTALTSELTQVEAEVTTLADADGIDAVRERIAEARARARSLRARLDASAQA